MRCNDVVSESLMFREAGGRREGEGGEGRHGNVVSASPCPPVFGLDSFRELNITVPGSLWRIQQKCTTSSHVYLVAPVIVPENLCCLVKETFPSHGPIQKAAVL